MDETIPAAVSSARQFPCRQCGARLEYGPGSTALQCPYCGSRTAIPQSEDQIEELDYRAALVDLASHEETLEEHRIKCGKCGAETTMPPAVTAGACPFCGTDLVVTGQWSRRMRPKALLPFKVAQREGFAIFRRWIRGLWFAPNDLNQYARSENRLSGIYVPYWTYDADTTSFYRGDRGDDYWVTQTYTTRENNQTVTRTRQVRQTRWTPVSGTVWNRFDDVLVMASESLPRAYAERLEPWDLGSLVPYADEYLSGFRAETYQLDLTRGFEHARRFMDEGIRKSVCEDIGGDHQRIHAVKTGFENVTFKYILLPVWLSSYRYREKLYRILINARTGELQGERPYSPWKIAAAVIAALAVIAVIVLVASTSR